MPSPLTRLLQRLDNAARLAGRPSPRLLAASKFQSATAVSELADAWRRERPGEVPAFGCMWFPRVTGLEDTLSLARRLYQDHRVLVAPGEYFGAPGHLRIGFGAEAGAIETGLQRLEAGLKSR